MSDNAACVDPLSFQYSQTAFEASGLQPGATYDVELYGTTGLAEGDKTEVTHIESKNKRLCIGQPTGFDDLYRQSN